RNRYTAVHVSSYPPFNVGNICWIFCCYRKSAWGGFHGFFNDSPDFAYCNADAHSFWGGLVGSGNIDIFINSEHFHNHLVSCQDLQDRDLDVWKETRLQGIIQVAEILEEQKRSLV